MDIEEFLADLELAEQSEQIVQNDECPLEIMAMGTRDQLYQQKCEPTNLPLGLGPFGNQDIKTEIRKLFLEPKQLSKDLLRSSQRILDRDVDLDSLVLLPTHGKLRPRLKVKRNLKDGTLDFSSFEEIFVNETILTAKNSTSLKREPVGTSDFVRGKATSVPFTPGGIEPRLSAETPQLDQDLDGLLDLKDLESVPPGFDRGIQFEVTDAAQLNISEIMNANDDILMSLMEEAVPVEIQDKGVVEESKEVIDDFLPETDQVLTVVPKKKKDMKQREWAHMVDVNQDFPEFYDLVPDMAFTYPFELDVFQKRAVYHLEKSESVFVAAHTSAGKTVVAEYAIALAQKHMTRAIYTSPIKALSNQKFRDFKDTFEDVGILTGDIQIRPEAACLVMTTEILRSMLYRGADLIRDVEFVIFDEVHYVNDADRGVVWEEVIIMLPAHVTLILLSATVPNTKEFADWVGRTKQKDIYVISTSKRPVPLEHHFFVGKDLIKIVDANKNFITSGYKKAQDIINPPKKPVQKSESNRGRQKSTASSPAVSHKQGGRNSTSTTDKNMFVHLVGHLKKQNLVPAIIFAFSKKKCEEYAQALTNLDLTAGQTEKSKIHSFIEKSLTCLVGTDRELPQVLRMRELLSRGIAVHHSGLLPILKEVVEILFTMGLVKVLFATETFAMGLNCPARTVVFAMTRKHDGQNFRNLLPGEYTQMSGRAGRRGLDSTGMVIIACGDRIPDELEVRTMILGKPTKLESQFRVTYNMILNLLRVEAIKVEDMIKRSFSENATQRALPEQEELRKEGSQLLSKLEKLDCTFCNKDLYTFYEYSSRVLGVTYSMNEKIIKSPVGLKALSTGRVILVNNQMYRNCIGVILGAAKTNTMQAETALRHGAVSSSAQIVSQQNEKSFWVFVLSENDNQYADYSALPVTYIALPSESSAICSIECLPYTAFATIASKQILVDSESILTQHKHTELELLKLQVLELGNELIKNSVPEYDWTKLRDLEFQENVREKQSILKELPKFVCYKCPDLVLHYSIVHKERLLKDHLAELEHNLSEMNLDLLPDYHQRVDVLKELGFVDQEAIVQIKGRVACEINTADELILTELILDNFFADYDPAEIVALLSCFVFQEKSQSEPVLTPKLEKGVEKIIQLTEKIANVQKGNGLHITARDAVDSLHFGLVEVVYEWARGLPFKYITELTDVLEGSIVRCIVRLSETCREVSGAARLVGDAGLYRKMEEAAQLIRRDIVFAASLYF